MVMLEGFGCRNNFVEVKRNKVLPLRPMSMTTTISPKHGLYQQMLKGFTSGIRN